MYLYYELVQVSVIGNVHSMKLIVNVPLKTANSQFTLYNVVFFCLPKCQKLPLLNTPLTILILV